MNPMMAGGVPNAPNGNLALTSHSAQRQESGASSILTQHGSGNHTAKIPLHYLNQTNAGFKGGSTVVHMVNGTP